MMPMVLSFGMPLWPISEAAPSKITKLVLDPWLWQGSETDATLLPA